MMYRPWKVSASMLAVTAFCAVAQNPATNYDEAKVPKYTLPDPLVRNDGSPVRDAKAWYRDRRPEILSLFETNMYGRTPRELLPQRFEVLSSEKGALGGKALRRQVRVHFTKADHGLNMSLLLYLPAEATGPVPVFLVPGFTPNHTIRSDPGILLADTWTPEVGNPKPVKRPSTEQSRGSMANYWPVEEILARGYGLVTFYYADIEPDFDGGFEYGIRPFFPKTGATEWGAIGAWAWGLSRALDYLETDKNVDAKSVALMGVSRLGKTALWAGAQDQRFAMVISDDSGEGGAALSRRRFGEQPRDLVTNFPYWFCANYRQYADNEDKLPMDQHMLLSLIAPRPLYVASAEEDLWADPRGEFLSAVYAGPVYRLLGAQDLGTTQMPPVNQPIMNTIGYHVRTGVHGITAYDWQQYLAFADKHLHGQQRKANQRQ